MDTKNIVAIAIAVTLAAVLFMPIASTVTDTTSSQSVDDEEHDNVTLDEWIDLEEYNVEEDSETVEVYDDTDESWSEVSSDDYEMNYEDGEIRFDENATDVEDEDDVRVSYEHTEVRGPANTIVGLVPMFLALLMLVGLAGPIMERM